VVVPVPDLADLGSAPFVPGRPAVTGAGADGAEDDLLDLSGPADASPPGWASALPRGWPNRARHEQY